MIFKEIDKDLGHIKVGKEQTIEFDYTTDVKAITGIITSCDCIEIDTRAPYKLIAKWKPKPIPHHLKEMGKDRYFSQKSIVVNYISEDNELEQVVVLLFSATVTE